MRIRWFHHCPDCGRIIYLGVYDWAEYNCISCGATLRVVPHGIPVNSMTSLYYFSVGVIGLAVLLCAVILTPLGRVFPWLHAAVPFWGVIVMMAAVPSLIILSLSAIMSTFSIVEHKEKMRIEDILVIADPGMNNNIYKEISLKPSIRFLVNGICLSSVMIAFPVLAYLSTNHWGSEAWIVALVCGTVLMIPGRYILRTIVVEPNGMQIKYLGFAVQYIKFQDIGQSFIVMKEEKDFPAALYIVGIDGNKKLGDINLLSFKKEKVAWLLTLPGLKVDHRLFTRFHSGMEGINREK